MRRASANLLCLVMALLAAVASADASQPSLDAKIDALLARFAKVGGLSASFREEKRMALLTVPLVSEGTLYYSRPGALARHTEKPSPSSLVLRGDTLTLADPEGSQTLDLDSRPSVRLLVDAFVGVLRGDRGALERHAHLTASFDGDGWSLSLRPKVPELRKLIEVIAFEGTGTRVKRMYLKDKNGDETVTTFSDLKFRGPFEGAELEKKFRPRR